MGRYKIFVAFLLFITQFTIVTNLYASTANTTIGGWTVTSKAPSGIGHAISATKSVMLGGKEIIKTSSAVIIPKAANVSKFVAKSGSLAVVTTAIDLMLDGVDWVLDPANNHIVYTYPLSPPNNEYGWSFGGIYYSTAQQACDAALSANFDAWGQPGYVQAIGDSTAVICYKYGGPNNFPGYSTIGIGYFKNPSYDPDAQEDQPSRSIPLSDIAAQVLDQADQDIRVGNPASPAVALSRAVAEDMINEAAHDDTKASPIVTSLDAAAVYPDVVPAEGSISEPAVIDPVTGEVLTPPKVSDLSLDFPVFCGWAPVVCEAAQVVLDAPAKVLEWVEAVKEWVKEKEDTDNELDIPDLDDQDTDFDLNVSGSCPANIVFIDTVVLGMPYKIEMEYPELCNILSSYVKPILIVMGSFYALLIIGGVRVNG